MDREIRCMHRRRCGPFQMFEQIRGEHHRRTNGRTFPAPCVLGIDGHPKPVAVNGHGEWHVLVELPDRLVDLFGHGRVLRQRVNDRFQTTRMLENHAI